jgi:hypothetical protein
VVLQQPHSVSVWDPGCPSNGLQGVAAITLVVAWRSSADMLSECVVWLLQVAQLLFFYDHLVVYPSATFEPVLSRLRSLLFTDYCTACSANVS